MPGRMLRDSVDLHPSLTCINALEQRCRLRSEVYGIGSIDGVGSDVPKSDSP